MYAFLCYSAPSSQSNTFERKFFKKLVDALKLATGSKASDAEIAFMDVDLTEGDVWEEKLLAGLNQATALVCLESPSLVNSEYCGREIACFLERSRELARSPDRLVPIVFVPWIPLQTKDANGFSVLPTMDETLSSIQLRSRNPQFDDIYKSGMLVEMKHWIEGDARTRHAEDFLDRLVSVIVGINQKASGKLPPVDKEWLKVAPNPFRSNVHRGGGMAPRQEAGAVHNQAQALDGGVHFVLVAASPDEIRKTVSRVERLQAYEARGGSDYKPFYPFNKRLAATITKAMASQDVFPLLHDDKPRDATEFANLASEAQSRLEPVFFIVDGATARLSAYSQVLENLDRGLYTCCAVIVPFDPTTERREEITGAINKVFVNRRLVDDAVLRIHYPESLEEFSITFAQLYERIKGRFRERIAAGTAPFECSPLPLVGNSVRR